MAELNCSACEDLRQTSAEFIVNGLTDDMCTSLGNDTGLNPSDDHNDCTDLNNLNDCLVGNMATEIDAYDVCDWKTFMKKYIPNVWTVTHAIICAICGIWTNIHSLWDKMSEVIAHINAVSYVGVLTLYRSSIITDTRTITDSNRTDPMVLPFDRSRLEGNIGSMGILSMTDNGKAITVNNTTSVPLLVDTYFNCSIRMEQHLASCYIVVTKDGSTVGQTPFITPTTYDQQVTGESFVLAPGETAVMRYYFAVGAANGQSWFRNLFYTSDGEDVHMCLEPNTSSSKNQGSYFKVKVTSIVEQAS